MIPSDFENLGTVPPHYPNNAALAEALRLLKLRYPACKLKPILLLNPERRAGSTGWHTDGYFTTSCVTIARLVRTGPATEFLTPFGIWRPELHVLYATPRDAVHRAVVSSDLRTVVRIFVETILPDPHQTYTNPTWLVKGEEPT